MAIISMAIYDPEEANKSKITERCLDSLASTCDLTKHKLFLIDNNSCNETKRVINMFKNWQPCTVITNDVNIGTAEAVNIGWSYRNGDHAVKVDNDVVWDDKDWLELLIECINRDKTIGIAGLKRIDCWENPKHEDPYYRSELISLHKPGHRHLIVEKVSHVIGTCQLYSSEFLDKIGYLYQPSLYGYDDVLASWRALKAGYKSVFLPQVSIHHIDPGNTPYQDWKHKHSGEVTQLVINIKNEYMNDIRPIYYNPFESKEQLSPFINALKQHTK